MKQLWEIISSSVDWSALTTALIAFIVGLIKRKKDIKKLEKAFGPEAVSDALKQVRKDI